MSSPADGPSPGFRNVLPAEGMPERLVGLAPVPDVVEPILDDLGGRRLEGEPCAEHDLARAARIRRVLEAALAIRQAQLVDREPGLRGVREEDVGRFEDRPDVRAVRAGVGPDGPADAPGHGEPELQPGQPGLLGLGRRAGHRDAGLRDVRRAVDAAGLGPHVDHEPADAPIRDDDVAPPARGA